MQGTGFVSRVATLEIFVLSSRTATRGSNPLASKNKKITKEISLSFYFHVPRTGFEPAHRNGATTSR